MPSHNPPVKLEQAQQLAAMGMEQDNAHQRWGWYCDGMEVIDPSPHLGCAGELGLSEWYRSAPGEPDRLIGVDWAAAPTVIDAILWVLGSPVGLDYWGKDMALFVHPDGRCQLRTTYGPWGMDADTPADLLAAMLEAVKENAS